VRSLGRALLDASHIYEDFLIPRSEGRLRRRRLPPYRSAIIGLVGRASFSAMPRVCHRERMSVGALSGSCFPALSLRPYRRSRRGCSA
jgi:hypothetical protein